MNKPLMDVRKMVLAAMLVASGILLPVLFHMLGLGSVFLPMHIPALIAGMMLPWPYALGVGVLTPVLSALLTGMPPVFPMLPIMVVELGVYALSGSLLAHKAGWKPVVALLTSMLLGRVAASLAAYVMVGVFQAPLPPTPWAYFAAMVSGGLPGLAVQLVLLPSLLLALQFSRRKKAV